MGVIDDIIKEASTASTIIPELSDASKAQLLSDNIPALLLPYRMETRFQQKEYEFVYVTTSYPKLPLDPGGVLGGIGDILPDRPEPPSITEITKVFQRQILESREIISTISVITRGITDVLIQIIHQLDFSEQFDVIYSVLKEVVLVSEVTKRDLEESSRRWLNTFITTQRALTKRIEETKTQIDQVVDWQSLIANIQQLIPLTLDRDLVREITTLEQNILNRYQVLSEQLIQVSQILISDTINSVELISIFNEIVDNVEVLRREIDILIRGDVSQIFYETIRTIQISIEETSIIVLKELVRYTETLQVYTQQLDKTLTEIEQSIPTSKEIVREISGLPILDDEVEISVITEVRRVKELRWELLVRVYPDEIEIDTHEKELTDEEYRDGKLFWNHVWFDPTNQEIGLEAWRPLVSAYGRPRAAWIVKATTPINLEIDLSLFDIPDTIIDNTSTALPDPQIDAGKQYWDTVWNSNGSKAVYEEAWNQISGEYGTPMSSVIVYATTPTNINQRALKQISDGLTFDNPLGSNYFPPEYPSKQVIEGRVKDVFEVKKVSGQNAEPQFPPQERREGSWTRAPHVKVLPDRFTVITQHELEGRLEYVGNDIPNEPLAVGLDPNYNEVRSEDEVLDTYFEGEELEGFEQIDEDLDGVEELIPQVEPALKWMTDFEEAERIGMGIRVTLGTEKPDGFEKVFVLGLKTQGGAPAEVGKNAIDELFTSLHYTGVGMSLLPQGAPTNNTTDEDAAFNNPDLSAEESYKNELTGPLFSVKQDIVNKSDGQWLADLLGIEYSTVYNLDNADNFDVSNAVAMNQALVSGTLLPFAEQLVREEFIDTSNPEQALAMLDQLRDYFTNNVSGRGFLPPIRVDQQPYGILATTAYSKWTSSNSDPAFHDLLIPVFNKMTGYWEDMRSQYVQQVDQDIKVIGIPEGTPEYSEKEIELVQARFMNLLGLNPVSVEWYQQLGISQGPAGVQLSSLMTSLGFSNQDLSTRNLLTTEFGIDAASANKNLIDKLFWFGENKPLLGGLVDKIDAEGKYLSELLEGRNYIDLLLEATLPTIRTQDFHKALDPNASSFSFPNSLLYLYLRYALLNQYFDSGMRVLDTAANHSSNIYGTDIRTKLNLFQSSGLSTSSQMETQWDYLLKNISDYPLKAGYNFGSYNSLAQYLRETYDTTDLADEKTKLLEVRKALEILGTNPSNKLERDFLEHIDLCTYRFDAWQNGLVNYRLKQQRESNRSGLYLGGYAWVENLTPDDTLEKVPEEELPEDLNPEDMDLYYDPKSMGSILAPSSAHAVAAAVMRNAYVSHSEGNSNSKVAINLSSERIRLARQLIEGIRQGQSLAALLGYRFERYLVEVSQGNAVNMRQHLYEIRKKYPLADINVKEDSEEDDKLKESIAAMNVADGLQIYEKSRDADSDFNTWLSAFTSQEQNVITAAIDVLANAIDAISDVAVSEAVFNSIQGNLERAKAFTSALSKNGQMPLPEAFETQNNGLTITHTLGLSFPPVREEANALALDLSQQNRSPRSFGEPSVNDWYQGIIPELNNIRLEVNYEGLTQPEVWTAEMLKLYAIDLMYLIQPGLRNDDGALATYVRHLVRCKKELNESIDIEVDFDGKGLLDGEDESQSRVSFSELELLSEKVNLLIGKARPMTNEHFQRYDAPIAAEENQGIFINNPKGYDIQHLRQRVEFLLDSSDYVKEGALDYLDFPVVRLIPGFGPVTISLENFLNNTLPTGLTRESILPQTECDLPYRGIAVLLDELNQVMLGFAPDEEIKTQKARDLKVRLLALWKFGFDSALPEKLSDDVDERLTQLIKQTRLVLDELEPQIEKAKELVQVRSEDDPDMVYKKLNEAISLITGFNFKLFPLFIVANQAEVNQGVQNTKIFNPNTNSDPDLADPYSEDEVELLMNDWIGDLARMREEVSILDDALMYAENLADDEPEFSLYPIQYPVGDGDNYWLGMEYPSTSPPEEGKKSLVLYGDKPTSGDWCALVIDEWNETIPDSTTNVAATFHYDQPNAKAPNCALLAVTPEVTGLWSWNDLVDTLDETLEMAKKRAVEPEHLDAYKKNGKHLFTKMFPAIASPIVDAERGFSLDLAANNNQEFYKKKNFKVDAGLSLQESPSLFGDEDRVKDESKNGGAGGFSVQLGRTELDF